MLDLEATRMDKKPLAAGQVAKISKAIPILEDELLMLERARSEAMALDTPGFVGEKPQRKLRRCVSFSNNASARASNWRHLRCHTQAVCQCSSNARSMSLRWRRCIKSM